MKTDQNSGLAFGMLVELSSLVDIYTNPNIFQHCTKWENVSETLLNDHEWMGRHPWHFLKSCSKVNLLIGHDGGDFIVTKPILNLFHDIDHKWVAFINIHKEEFPKYIEYDFLNKAILFWEEYLGLGNRNEGGSSNNAIDGNTSIETTLNRVSRILAPLSMVGKKGMAILESQDLQLLIEIYTSIIDRTPSPSVKKKIILHGSNAEFYTILRKVYHEFDLKIKGTGIKLAKYLSDNRTNRQIHPSTIERNLFNIKLNKM
jgi:hypothetical protein